MASPLINYDSFTTLPANPSPEQLARWLDDGRAVLRDAADPLRLYDAISTGRATPDQRRRLLGRLIDGAKAQLSGLAGWLADGLARGTATLTAWFKRFSDIAATHNYAGVMTATGTIDPTPADRKAADGEVRKQLGFLARFREQLRTGAQPLFNLRPDPETGKRVASDGFRSRSEMYSDAIHGTAEAVIRDGMIRDGYGEERRVLHSSDHCGRCPELARMGWQPAGVLPRIGEGTPCLVRCRCSFQWRHPGDNKIHSSPLMNTP